MDQTLPVVRTPQLPACTGLVPEIKPLGMSQLDFLKQHVLQTFHSSKDESSRNSEEQKTFRQEKDTRSSVTALYGLKIAASLFFVCYGAAG